VRRRPHAAVAGALGTTLVLWITGCGQSRPASGRIPEFDENRAFAHLTRQVDMGYRVPGAPGHRRTLEYLRETLERHADSVYVQPFSVTNADTIMYMSNIIGYFKGGSSETLLLGAHWDTRLWADEDPNPASRRTPIAGANDGASGVAVLLELARILGETQPPRNIEIVFFDGEDQGDICDLSWCMGSAFYARRLKTNRPDRAIVVDMIGDRDLEIWVEANSEKYAYGMVRKVWSAAEDLEVSQFRRKTKYTMYDDHVPLIEKGIPAIVIIDFDYPHWHTLEDTPDKCSPQSLGAVGRVLTAVVYGT